VHKGPLAYAEAFLDPNEMNKHYSKELKKEFKNTFKRLIDSYQKGIEMYGQLANKLITGNDEHSASNRLSLNVSNLINTTLTQQTATKYLDMYRLLQDKFNEVENSFRNLLLIDGDFDLYQQQLKVHSQTSRTQVLTDINNSSIMTSSNA
jgi:vacuolar-type H+-ATPase catalytic subunit A/Vma1